MESNSLQSDVAYEKIRDLIFSGEVFPGTRLVIPELEKRFGLGKGPIRDALMSLSKSGLVENVPYKGAMVKFFPSLIEIECFYAMRIKAERILAIEAMKNITPEYICILQQCIDMQRSFNGHISTYFKLDQDFHKKLYHIANLEHLENVVDTIMDHINIFLSLYIYSSFDRDTVADQHQEILEALKEQDAKRLNEAIKKNVLIGLTFLKKYFAKLERCK